MPTDEENAASRVTLYSPKKTCSRPKIVISYRNVRGIESDYTFQTVSLGRAGTAYIGDFAMQNTLVVPLASAPSDVMPFSVSLVYNSGMTGRYFSSSYDSLHTANFDTMKTGIGWKLSLQETVVAQSVGSTQYLVYTDSDGTEHYYPYSSSEGGYVEEGKSTRLTITGSTSQYTLADEYGGKKIFTNSFLTETKDAYGNALYYCYDGADYSAGSTAWKPTAAGAHKITSVWRANRGCTAEKLLVLGYNGELLSTLIPKCDYTSESSKSAYRISLTCQTVDGCKYLSAITFVRGSSAAAYTSSASRKQDGLLSASAATSQPGVNLLRNGNAEGGANYWENVYATTAAASPSCSVIPL